MAKAIPCTMMRGGTSRGAYFLGSDMPSETGERDALLLRVMGSPDVRQIDGIGGADPLTSKVAFVSPSERPGVDVDYLFLQVFVDRPVVSTAQNCGNILAGIGGFAIEHGLVQPKGEATDVSIYMVNSDQVAVANIQTPGGEVAYDGDAHIDGVPGTAAPVLLKFLDAAGSMCGSLLPTGNAVDEVAGVRLTCIDNGMPVVVMRASDLRITGYEDRATLDADASLKARLEAIRLEVGPMMNLGDVREKSVPKMILVAPPRAGGAISTRSFIPHRCHASVGVLAGLSVATAALLPGTPAAEVAVVPAGAKRMGVEHPSGMLTVVMGEGDGVEAAKSASYVSTARKLFEGMVFPR